MGNHTAGDLVHLNIQLELAKREPGQPALEILDKAMERAMAAPGFSPDAEFESADPNNPGHVNPLFHDNRYPHRDNPMGLLLVEAFAPDGLTALDSYLETENMSDAEEEALSDRIWDDIILPFSTRYGLC